jgi:WD40 repeat protein
MDKSLQLVLEGGIIELWDVKTDTMYQRFEGHSRCVAVAKFSPNGSIPASKSNDETVRLWDVETGNPRIIFGDHLETVGSVAFSLDG